MQLHDRPLPSVVALAAELFNSRCEVADTALCGPHSTRLLALGDQPVDLVGQFADLLRSIVIQADGRAPRSLGMGWRLATGEACVG
jgi:hypothetical protein